MYKLMTVKRASFTGVKKTWALETEVWSRTMKIGR